MATSFALFLGMQNKKTRGRQKKTPEKTPHRRKKPRTEAADQLNSPEKPCTCRSQTPAVCTSLRDTARLRAWGLIQGLFLSNTPWLCTHWHVQIVQASTATCDRRLWPRALRRDTSNQRCPCQSNRLSPPPPSRKRPSLAVRRGGFSRRRVVFPIPGARPLRPMHCWQRTADSKPLFRAQKQMAHTKVFAALHTNGAY